MHTRELRAPDLQWGRPAISALTWACAAAALVFVIGLFASPHRTWSGFLVGFHVLVGLALAGPMGIAFLHLSGARWSRSLEVVPRAMASALPAAAGLGLVLLLGVSSLFEWSHASAVTDDPILQEKSAYLNFTFFAVRLVVIFGAWLWAGRRVVRASLSTRGDDASSRRTRLRTAAVFLLLFGPTWSLASIDWLQSLDPHWFSSIYALLTLAGLGVSGLAAAVVLIAALDTDGSVSKDQYGDLGALLLSLALFWAYIWYCQYMLVWYTNLPEETPWYVSRLAGSWGMLTKLACVLCGALPFTLLLFRRLRRSRRALVRIAGVILVGRVIDLLVMAGPPLWQDGPVLGLWELAPILGCTGLFFLLALRALQRTAASGDLEIVDDSRRVVATSAPVDPQPETVGTRASA